ncbi:hypothetical protein BU16DRAFT_356312 [Lophium mytilinum]|uniref:F-box domain-containing protein n=1 Tax=Lophium mytilinum TaxID=390894 RepID=A0A6A6QXK2_9PEZI|nr:hypothetical protein BU16DRAFT_356312 [Lophium mytilinum]
MVCPLLGLSDELQLMIVELVVAQDHGREDLVSLSSTCSTYRLLLAPIIFDRVTLLNDAESAASAIALANSHHGQYVKQLRFEGSLNRDGYRRVIEQHTEGLDINKLRTIVQEAREKLFPESVYRVLSDLQHWFSKLDILTIRIEEQNAAWYESSPLPVGVRDLFDHPDLFKATIKRRKIHNWGQLQAKTYEALCENQNHNIKTLQILDLSRECDALDDPKFHKFLERIRTVGISHVLACRKRHGSAHYFETTRYLSRRFIDHLPSVQHLKLKGPVYGAWSYEGLPYDWTKEATLPLKVTQMPQLKSINLSRTLVSQEMISFFVSHQDTLEHITLQNCYAYTPTQRTVSGRILGEGCSRLS